MPAGGVLGIKAGEIWAYKLHLAGPLVPARVIKPGRHYEASIEVILLDGPSQGQRLWTRRNRLPCKWDDREIWLAAHPDVRREVPETAELPDDPFELPADMLFGMGESVLRRLIREELEGILNVPVKVAYTYTEAARAVGLSETALREAVQRNDLVPSYYNSKPLFARQELERWVMSLPASPE